MQQRLSRSDLTAGQHAHGGEHAELVTTIGVMVSYRRRLERVEIDEDQRGPDPHVLALGDQRLRSACRPRWTVSIPTWTRIVHAILGS